MQKQLLIEMIRQNITTCSFSFNKITNENAGMRLNAQAASVGFIYRHTGETINLFGWFLGLPTEVQNTTMGYQDTGQGLNVAESHALVQQGYERLEKYVNETSDDAWLDPVDTPFFGTVTRMRLFSHILFHNSHHAGQISLTLSRGGI